MAANLLNRTKQHIPRLLNCICDNTFRTPRCQIQSQFISNKDKYQVNVYVKGYHKNELSVVAGHEVLLVKGQREVREQNKTMNSCFVKAYNIPKDCIGSEIKSIFTRSGVLKIMAPRKQSGTSMSEPQPEMVVVPIEKQDYFRVKPIKASPSDDKWASKYTYVHINSPGSSPKSSEPKSCE